MAFEVIQQDIAKSAHALLFLKRQNSQRKEGEIIEAHYIRKESDKCVNFPSLTLLEQKIAFLHDRI